MDHNSNPPVGLLPLPAEILNRILEYVFDDTLPPSPPSSVPSTRACPAGFLLPAHGGLQFDADYSAPARLRPLLACRRFYAAGQLLALHRTTFTVANLFASLPARLAALGDPRRVGALRALAVVVDARHFRKLRDWRGAPFGCGDLRLATLSLVLHDSSFGHYLFDFTADLVALLRDLGGVRRLVFVRNHASVKGSFKAWFHRLVGLIMKVDHRERYERGTPNLERTWWEWSWDEEAQTFALEARPAREWVEEEEYMRRMAPLVEQLRIGIEGEEWNPDPRARNGT